MFQVQKLHVCMSHSNSEELTIVLCIAKIPAQPSMMVLRYAYLAGPEVIQPAVCAACLAPPNVVREMRFTHTYPIMLITALAI